MNKQTYAMGCVVNTCKKKNKAGEAIKNDEKAQFYIRLSSKYYV